MIHADRTGIPAPCPQQSTDDLIKDWGHWGALVSPA